MLREKPTPPPPLRPIWEHEAEGALRDAYAAYKATLGVPWVGVVSLAYAQYRHFFARWWAGVEPLIAQPAYTATQAALRTEVEAAVTAFNPPPIAARLAEMGYAPRERAEIRAVIETLSAGNFAQIPIVFAARMLLEGGEFRAGDEVAGSALKDKAPRLRRQPEATLAPLTLIERHHALGDVAALYDDVKSALGLPFVNTDYRALARWPSFFRAAWSDLRPHLATETYDRLAQRTHGSIVAAVRALPNPGGLTAAALQEAARADGAPEELHRVTKLFTWLLPGLALNVAFFRAQLAEEAPLTRDGLAGVDPAR